MPKNIILCADGTGNRGGVGRGTNVWKLHRALDPHDSNKQVTYYHDGVGTQDFFFTKLLGGAFGWGLSDNVRSLYYYLWKHYEAGDRVYLFGFSRGAYTVRLLANLLHLYGIPTKSFQQLSPHDRLDEVKKLYSSYQVLAKNNDQLQKDIRKESQLEPEKYLAIDIECIGVWDTVGAVGLPANWMRKFMPNWTSDASIRCLPASCTQCHSCAFY